MIGVAMNEGGHGGWHSHPGSVFLRVTSGTLTFYDSHDPSCSPLVRSAGQVFVESGEHAHRNGDGERFPVLVIGIKSCSELARIWVVTEHGVRVLATSAELLTDGINKVRPPGGQLIVIVQLMLREN